MLIAKGKILHESIRIPTRTLPWNPRSEGMAARNDNPEHHNQP